MTNQKDRNAAVSSKFVTVCVGGDHFNADVYDTLVLFALHDDIHRDLEGLRDMLNKVLKHSARASEKAVDDKLAEQEMESVKEIIDRHHAAGWLLGYHHEDVEGFTYRYSDGLYEARAEQEAAA